MLKCGIVGAGYIAPSHIEAVRRIGFVEIKVIADTNYGLACNKAKAFHIPSASASVDGMLADPEINVIHNCTPNFLHKEINERILKAGKHLFSEKPLARTSAETGELVAILKQTSNVVAGVNFNYRMNPLVREMIARVRSGEIGRPLIVHGSFMQDWLLYETDYNWRIEPEVSGPSRCVADLGSHWIDLVQVVTGSKITEVCADLYITIPVRKKPKGVVEAFSINTNAEYEDKVVKTEDYGAFLLRMDNGAHGIFQTSEVSAGRKVRLDLEVNGELASMYWNQEDADRMWFGYRDKPNGLVIRNPNFMPEEAKKYTSLSTGHPEGWNDAMTNNVRAFYNFIVEGKVLGKDKCDFATFEDGHYNMKVIEAVLKSSKERRWVSVQ